jgi:ribonuclease HII
MAWVVGIDEAGYGPNLGPLVMSSVACRLPDLLLEANLWQALPGIVCQGKEQAGRLLIDDSKIVNSGVRGLANLERGVLSVLWRREPSACCLADYLSSCCVTGLDDVRAEPWFKGAGLVPEQTTLPELLTTRADFDRAAEAAGIGPWHVHSVVVPAPRFNSLLDIHESKGAILAHAMTQLLRVCHAELPPGEAQAFYVDKHGGRNTYAAFLQDALPAGVVIARQESALCSRYEVVGLGQPVRITFQPRADSEHFCVALASMASKYLRERLMAEFNHYWQQHVPGLKPTAGYPGDAGRFLEAIRPALARLGMAETAVWRRK